jgi:hypothetical protein
VPVVAVLVVDEKEAEKMGKAMPSTILAGRMIRMT